MAQVHVGARRSAPDLITDMFPSLRRWGLALLVPGLLSVPPVDPDTVEEINWVLSLEADAQWSSAILHSRVDLGGAESSRVQGEGTGTELSVLGITAVACQFSVHDRPAYSKPRFDLTTYIDIHVTVSSNCDADRIEPIRVSASASDSGVLGTSIMYASDDVRVHIGGSFADAYANLAVPVVGAYDSDVHGLGSHLDWSSKVEILEVDQDDWQQIHCARFETIQLDYSAARGTPLRIQQVPCA